MTIINLGSSVTAAPQRVSPLTAIDVSTAVQECTDALPLAKRVLTLSRTVSVCLSPIMSGQHAGQRYYFAWDSDNRSVLYFVRFSSTVRLAKPGRPDVVATRQVLVKQVSDDSITAGLARKVFWEFLLPELGVVASDNQQTKDGERVWVNVVAHALQTGYHVYLTDTNTRLWTNPKTLEEFTNEVKPKAWGSPSFFQRMILVVSKRSL